jgi:hypothetical protein
MEREDEDLPMRTGNDGNNASSSELGEEQQLPQNQDTLVESLAVALIRLVYIIQQ